MQEVPGSIPGYACRPNRSEFSMIFSETRVNTGWNPIERLHGGHSTHRPRSLDRQSALKPPPPSPSYTDFSNLLSLFTVSDLIFNKLQK